MEKNKLREALEERGDRFKREWLRELKLILWDEYDATHKKQAPCNATMVRWQLEFMLATATREQKELAYRRVQQEAKKWLSSTASSTSKS